MDGFLGLYGKTHLHLEKHQQWLHFCSKSNDLLQDPSLWQLRQWWRSLFKIGWIPNQTCLVLWLGLFLTQCIQLCLQMFWTHSAINNALDFCSNCGSTGTVCFSETYINSLLLPVGRNFAPRPPLPPLRFAHGLRLLTAQHRRGSLGKAQYTHCGGRKKTKDSQSICVVIKCDHLRWWQHLY